jgi:IS5 family transposase
VRSRSSFPPKKGDKTKQREAAYRDLLAVTQETYAYGRIAEAKIRALKPASVEEALKARSLGGGTAWTPGIDDTGHRSNTSQSDRKGEKKVPAHEKLVSIFEKHTDIIIKDQRDTFFGHKICDRRSFVADPRLRDRKTAIPRTRRS